MKTICNPPRESWRELSKRPVQDSEEVTTVVRDILADVQSNGDEALRRLTLRYDKWSPENLRFDCSNPPEPSRELRSAIDLAIRNVRTFHIAQRSTEAPVEIDAGIRCWRSSIPIDRVGLYIPGGSAPLFSSLIMLAVPATLAGCPEIVVCSPAFDGKPDPALVYTAWKLGINELIMVGGAQAIAAMAYGTESIDPVSKIFGPGNQYVTHAKQLVQMHNTAIDMPAGPSEVLVIADNTADPDFVAADLLSQAEHGPDSQVILVTDSAALAESVTQCLSVQLSSLPRREIAERSLAHSRCIVFESIEQCMDFSNQYAPEHLILNINNAEAIASQVSNAGSVFIGQWSCESLGDYASGPNHTLPTGAWSRAYSGVSLESFQKRITFQKVTREGLLALGPAVETLASAEQLEGHKRAVSIRLKRVSNG